MSEEQKNVLSNRLGSCNHYRGLFLRWCPLVVLHLVIYPPTYGSYLLGMMDPPKDGCREIKEFGWRPLQCDWNPAPILQDAFKNNQDFNCMVAATILNFLTPSPLRIWLFSARVRSRRLELGTEAINILLGLICLWYCGLKLITTTHFPASCVTQSCY